MWLDNVTDTGNSTTGKERRSPRRALLSGIQCGDDGGCGGRGKQKGIKIGGMVYDEIPKILILMVVSRTRRRTRSSRSS